jgi:hypothetical protein
MRLPGASLTKDPAIRASSEFATRAPMTGQRPLAMLHPWQRLSQGSPCPALNARAPQNSRFVRPPKANALAELLKDLKNRSRAAVDMSDIVSPGVLASATMPGSRMIPAKSARSEFLETCFGSRIGPAPFCLSVESAEASPYKQYIS